MSITWTRFGTWAAAAGCLYMMWLLNADWLVSFQSVFLGILFDAFPFLLLGVLASAVLETFVSDKFVQGLVPGNKLGGVLVGSLLGMALPICECGMVPVVRRLIRKGLPSYIGIVYIAAGPIINPIVVASTFIAFRNDPQLAYARFVLALAVSIALGLLLALFMRRSPLREDGAADPLGHDHHHHAHGHHGHAHHHGHDHHGHVHHHDHDHEHSVHPHSHNTHGMRRPNTWRNKLSSIASHAAEDLWDTGKYLLLGAALTGLIQSVVRPETFAAAAGHNILSHLFLMGFAYALSLCSTSDAFVAASLSHLFHPGALLAFLVFGPMFDLKNTFMMLAVFRRSFVWKFAAATAALVFAGSLIYEKLGWINF